MHVPFYRLPRKTSNERVGQQNAVGLERAVAHLLERRVAEEHEHHGDIWEGFADELEDHSRRAKKLAEIVRSTKIVKKVAGRTVPNSTHYTQTTTKMSTSPIK